MRQIYEIDEIVRIDRLDRWIDRLDRQIRQIDRQIGRYDRFDR